MENFLVSVYMITYNHAPFIAQAIEGVLQQKVNFPVELVIGEDCSTDGTREIVFEYQRKYPEIIRVITSETNVGATQNGQRTIKGCHGKYMAICEGDDYWQNPDKLQKQVDYLESHHECGMVVSDCNIEININNNKKIIENFNYNRGIHDSRYLTLETALGWGKIHIFTCTAMIRKNLLESLIENDPYLYQSGHFLTDDIQIWIEMVLQSKVFYMQECMGTYRYLDESASSTNDMKKMLKFWLSSSEVHLHLCNKYSLPKHIRERIESTYYDLLLRLAFLERNADLALEVKKKKKKFTLKNWIYYCCLKKRFLHYIGLRVLELQYIRYRANAWQ